MMKESPRKSSGESQQKLLQRLFYEPSMNDAEHSKARNEFARNVGASFLVFLMLIINWHLGFRLIHQGQPLKDSLQIMTLATAFPAFVITVVWNRISRETIGMIIAAVLGFALGKFG
jgi:hypothetical protein